MLSSLEFIFHHILDFALETLKLATADFVRLLAKNIHLLFLEEAIFQAASVRDRVRAVVCVNDVVIGCDGPPATENVERNE